MRRASIVNNSFWYGLETAGDVLIGVAASIAIARVIGPERLGHLAYLTFVTSVAGRLGSDGVGAAARKYMAEYFGRGDLGMARSVFSIALQCQVVIAVFVTSAGLAIAANWGEPQYRPAAGILVLAIAPSLINVIPSQANMAAERFSRNVPSAVAGMGAYVVTVVLALTLGWGVTGLAATILARRTVEVLIRIVPVLSWMRRLPRIARPEGILRTLLVFSGQSLAITVLTLIVWDRSEMIFLKAFCSAHELAYYSLAFNIAAYTLLLPNVVGSAVGANILAEHGSSSARTGATAQNAIAYLSLLIFPVNFGLAALSGPAIHIAYGPVYQAVAPVLAISAILAIPKAFYWLPYTIHVAANRQTVIFRWLLAAAALNIALDALLIPRYGAVGAAIANGVAQSSAVAMLFRKATRLCPLRLDGRSLTAGACSALAMTAVALALTAILAPASAAIAGVISGIGVYFTCIRASRAVPPEVADANLAGLPSALQRCLKAVLVFATGMPRAATQPEV